MRKSIDEVRRRIVDGQEKTVVLEGALQRARRQPEMGSPDAAMETVHEALKIDATYAETLRLRAKVDSALTLKQQAEREQGERENRARTVITEARRQFAAGDRQSALNALEGFRPPSSIVTNALAELQVEAREIERRTAAMERQRLEAEVVRLKQDAEEETQRLETAAERHKLQAEVERLKREEVRRKTPAPSLSSRVRAAERVGTQRGLLIGGVAAAVVALAVAGWMFWPSRDVANEAGQQPGATRAAVPGVPVPQEAAVSQQQQQQPPPQPQLQTPAPAPVQTAAPPVVESRPSNTAQQGVQPAAQQTPRGRGRADQPSNVATPVPRAPVVSANSSPSPSPLAAAAAAATPQPSAPAAASDPAAARNRDLAQQALDTGTRSEAAGDLTTALQWLDRARQLDPSGPTTAPAAESINRIRARMKKEGTDAFAKGRAYDALDRVDQAIKEYEVAVRYLPDDDPNKKVAQTRLDALKR